MLTHVVRVFQVLHNGDIIADGYVRPLKPQAAKGAEDRRRNSPRLATEDAPAKGAADKAAAGKVSHSHQGILIRISCLQYLPRRVVASELAGKMTPEINGLRSCEAHYRMMASQ